MSRWTGRYVIGLTGNIGTGKSVVRKMLEHLGAYGIDADALGHRAIAKGAPGYQPVLQAFGSWVLGADEQIDRGKLGKLVFADPEAMSRLEHIVHPLVDQAVDMLVRRAPHRVVVIEAIKLLESGLGKSCDAIWVSHAAPGLQLTRLMQNRHMSEMDARQRIQSQPSQEAKVQAAQVVIQNEGTFEDTWKQVSEQWKRSVPAGMSEPQTTPRPEPVTPLLIPDALTVDKGKPKHTVEIAAFLNRMKRSGPPMGSENVMAAFGEKAFLLLRARDKLVGLVGWQVENLIAKAVDILLDPQISAAQALPPLLTEMETSSNQLLCEIALVFVPVELARLEGVWRSLGYERKALDELTIQAWYEAATESVPPGTVMFFKQLRRDRILRPI